RRVRSGPRVPARESERLLVPARCDVTVQILESTALSARDSRRREARERCERAYVLACEVAVHVIVAGSRGLEAPVPVQIEYEAVTSEESVDVGRRKEARADQPEKLRPQVGGIPADRAGPLLDRGEEGRLNLLRSGRRDDEALSAHRPEADVGEDRT